MKCKTANLWGHQWLDTKTDPFRPAEEGEEILSENIPYLSAIGALVYLPNQTRPDISFTVNLLARYNTMERDRTLVQIPQTHRRPWIII